jgi:hypothetical protein
MKERHPVHQTQWAAQFAVASELCKRGYQVALTMGNHPIVDIMVFSPKGKSFQIDVKGLYKPAYWLVKPKKPRDGLFYVFAYVPAGQPNEFFVMTQRQVNKAIQTSWDKFRAKHGRPRADISENRMPGVEWKFARKYLDKWNALPA